MGNTAATPTAAGPKPSNSFPSGLEEEGPDEEFHDAPTTIGFFMQAPAGDDMGGGADDAIELAQARDNIGQYRPSDFAMEFAQASDNLGQYRSSNDILEFAQASDNMGQYRPSNDILEFAQASDNMGQYRPSDDMMAFAQAADNTGQYRPSDAALFVQADDVGRFRPAQAENKLSLSPVPSEDTVDDASDSDSTQKDGTPMSSSFFTCCSGKTHKNEKNTEKKGGKPELDDDNANYVDHSQMTDDELGQLGISVHCIKNVFMPEVRKAGLDERSKIYEIENLHDDNQGVIRKKSANYICPITNQMGAAYVHVHKHKDLVGLATIMLSYAWGYTIGDIIDTLLLYCLSNNLDPKRTYVWICCLCVNQHRVVESMRRGVDIPFDVFQRTFFKRVTSIGHILAMMAPWQAPYYLRRAWCVFEMFTASQHGCKITIGMPSSERQNFLHEITSGGIDDHVNKLFQTLANTSVANAEASVESDLSKILKLIEDGKGYEEFDIVINGLIRDWVIQIILDAVESKREALDGEQCNSEHAFFLNQVGTLFANIGEYEKAASMFEPVLAFYDDLYGSNHVGTSSILNNIALVFEQQGKFQTALNYYDRVLTIDEKHKGKDHVDTALTLTNMAGVLWRQGKYDEALNILNRSFAIQDRVLGDHINTANTMNTMAIIFNRQAKYEKALETYRRVLMMKEKLLGKDHTSTANTINNVGLVLKNLGAYDEASNHYHRALATYEKVLGKNHPNTLRTQQNIELVQCLIDGKK